MARTASNELDAARKSFARRAWDEAYRAFSKADAAAVLESPDLERLATSAYLIGREDDYLQALDRAHHAYLAADDEARAARCAFWIGLSHLFRGASGQASGWLARAKRLVAIHDCVERGYLLVPVAEGQLREAQLEAAFDTAAEAAAYGERFGDKDLTVAARHIQGRVRLLQSAVQDGLALLDEAMVAVVAGELTPIMTGLIYCSVIDACQQAYALSRAREWTVALASWCARQPEMVAFTETCLVHRAEIMQLQGAWPDAVAEAERACRRFTEGLSPEPPAAALYQQGEVHRLRGDFTAAEIAYQQASQGGLDPQPGLALLWLARGRTSAAAAGIRRALDTETRGLERARLLPACVEIMLAANDREQATQACSELAQIAAGFGTEVLVAQAAQADAMLELAQGQPKQALRSLQRARELWQQVEAPYLSACVRELTGRACIALGDEGGGRLELDAARAVFASLGATPRTDRIDALLAPGAAPHALTGRELQVLRLLAKGLTNKAIAAELVLSEKTIDRHVSNLFGKLDVSSRAAATAYAYEHELI